VLIIGASTGGPRALIEVIPHLPPDCRDAIIVVQHMPAEFTPSFARRLNDLSFLPVKEAQEGDSIHAGRVLVAPGDFHLEIGPDRRVHLSRGPHRHGVRPAVDVTLETAVPVFRDRVTAVVLTGMGADGAEGCAKVVAAGGTVVAQDRDSSNIWGMPRAVAERNPSAIVVPLSAVPETLVRLARERSRETV
jgi:two-component system chemotaxis response regulator CheB